MRSTERSVQELEALCQSVISVLPRMNHEIELGCTGVDTLLAEFIEWVCRIDELRGFGDLEAPEALLAVQLLELGMGSLERHYKALGLPPGMTRVLVPMCGDLLVELGEIGTHAPAIRAKAA